MSAISEIFHIGAAILSTTIDGVTNTVLAQLGGVQDEYVFSDSADMYGSLGLASRPAKPTKGVSAAECIAIKGDRDRIIAARDVRGQAIYGNLKDGETCLYGPGEFGTAQGRVMIKQDGSVTLMTTDTNTGPESGGQVVALRISPQGGLEFTSQWGFMTLDKYGFNVKTGAGASIELGGLTIPGLSGIPGVGSVVEKMGAYATITAPFVNVNGAITTLGTGPLYYTAAVVIPGPPGATQISPNIPGTLANIVSLTTSGTVLVSAPVPSP